MAAFHVTLLTDARYVAPKPGDWYVENIHLEDQILGRALQQRGCLVHRIQWDAPGYDWNQTDVAVFRTTWDYFDRVAAFSAWLDATSQQTRFLNPVELVRWNMDKHYLADLRTRGIRIPPTVFIEAGSKVSLAEAVAATGWGTCVLKPAVGGAARHTYRLEASNLEAHDLLFQSLVAEEAMLLQEFMWSVPARGEVALMVMNGKCTHAVLKKAKAGDFRVQDDFGGTVADYVASAEEVEFAEAVVRTCVPAPVYARVDMVWDNDGLPAVSELELIEPELWFRNCALAAEVMAEGILTFLRR